MYNAVKLRMIVRIFIAIALRGASLDYHAILPLLLLALLSSSAVGFVGGSGKRAYSGGLEQ